MGWFQGGFKKGFYLRLMVSYGLPKRGKSPVTARKTGGKADGDAEQGSRKRGKGRGKGRRGGKPTTEGDSFQFSVSSWKPIVNPLGESFELIIRK